MYVIIETCDREQNALFSEDIAVARQMLYDLAVENELYEVDHDEIMQGLVTGVKEGDYRAELLEARPIQPKSLPGGGFKVHVWADRSIDNPTHTIEVD